MHGYPVSPGELCCFCFFLDSHGEFLHSNNRADTVLQGRIPVVAVAVAVP